MAQAFFMTTNLGSLKAQEVDAFVSRTPPLKVAVTNVKGFDQIETREGHILSLSGVINPFIDDRRPALNDQITDRLKDVLLDQNVVIYPAQSKLDHQGRQLVFIANKGKLLTELLLAEGLVLYWPSDEYALDDQHHARLLSVEAEARGQKRGLWQYGDDLIRCANNALKQQGRPALVVGQVHSVSEAGSRMFLNFSADWDEDFTIMAEGAAISRALKAKSLMAGDTIMVRGWVERWRGPFIKLTDTTRLTKLPDTALDAGVCH